MINSIGLAGPGLRVFIEERLPEWLPIGVPIIVNISGANSLEFITIAGQLSETDIKAIEANISCLNRGGIVIGTDPKLTAETVRPIRLTTDKFLIVKLTPNVTDIAEIAKVAEAEGADAISLINTVRARDVDIETGKPKIGRGFGGLSGPEILPIALDAVAQVSQAVKIPIIGMGGIRSAEDAIKFVMYGATAVAIGTENFRNPFVIPETIAGIRSWLEEKGLCNLDQIRGMALRNAEGA
jgi:dihydroorotate dehydrogenase (NAD+) catalytic subunit